MAQSTTDQRMLARIDELIQAGEQVLATHRTVQGAVGDPISLDTAMFAQWRARCLACLNDFPGPNSAYTQSFEQQVHEPRRSETNRGLGIMRGLRVDVAAGYLTTVRELIHADVFGDFLDMAAYLLGEGYKDPAAVLIGGVLEEHLRQLCIKNGIATDVQTPNGVKSKKAESMNVDLVKASVYTGAEQKQVTAWLGLRNDAAHSNYTAYTDQQVDLFQQGVLGFVARHPA